MNTFDTGLLHTLAGLDARQFGQALQGHRVDLEEPYVQDLVAALPVMQRIARKSGPDGLGEALAHGSLPGRDWNAHDIDQALPAIRLWGRLLRSQPALQRALIGGSPSHVA